MTGHLYVQDHQVGRELLHQLDRTVAVRCLADHRPALLLEQLDEVESDQRLVLGDDDATLPVDSGPGPGADTSTGAEDVDESVAGLRGGAASAPTWRTGSAGRVRSRSSSDRWHAGAQQPTELCAA